ncbi:hypothetical protein [Rummeliibacillus stabekisii]|uniref:hypothetical protein n=1 Tax=Rummeliibacillus stabekisii TaxID=241244 RepID=UPI00371B9845
MTIDNYTETLQILSDNYTTIAKDSNGLLDKIMGSIPPKNITDEDKLLLYAYTTSLQHFMDMGIQVVGYMQNKINELSSQE